MQAARAAQAIVESRSLRRRRRLDNLEIPEDQLFLTDEVLGKGGFGTVFLADFNGRNAAAKVVEIEHDLGPGQAPDEIGASEGDPDGVANTATCISGT